MITAVKTFASDALHDAMMMSQTKAINSYSFKDCLNYLNLVWRDIYQRLNRVDTGYYTKTVRLKEERTRIPPFVMNTVKVFAAQSPGALVLDKYKQSGNSDRNAYKTYSISGDSLLCPDAVRRTVWCTYVPQPPILFFTKNNRDPRIVEAQVKEQSNVYGMWLLQVQSGNRYVLRYRKSNTMPDLDITESILFLGEDWTVEYLNCDFPYAFISYKNTISGEYVSYIFRDLSTNITKSEYNPYAYTGRESNVEYYKTWWNDSTGLGAIFLDHRDNKLKEMGYTPDTELDYPVPEMYRLLVCKLARKFAEYNESELMLVSSELADAEFAFDTYLCRDQSSFSRIDLMNTGALADYL